MTVGTGGMVGNLPALVTVGNGQVILNRSDVYTYTGVISGLGSVVIDGGINGGLQLNTVQTYGGGTTVVQGSLTYNVNNALTTTGNLGIGANGRVDLNGFNATVNGLNNFTVGSAGVITNNNAVVTDTSLLTVSSGTFSGQIGPGTFGAQIALTKAGTGTLALSGNNTFSLDSTITGGTIVVGNNNALGTGRWYVSGGIAGDAALGARTINNTILSFTNGLTVGGTTPMTFSQVVSYTGSRSITVNNTALTTFNSVEFSDSATARTLTMNIEGPTLVHTLTHSSPLAGLTPATSGNIIMNFSGGHTLTLDQVNDYVGSTVMSGSGKLYVKVLNGLGNTAITVNRGSMLHIAPGASAEIGGSVMNINGGGFVYAEGHIGNSGNINVNNGGLLVVDGSTAGGTIAVNGSGVLTGTGGVNGFIDLRTGGNFRIGGDTIAAPNLAGIYIDSGVLDYQLGDAFDPGGSDKLTFNGSSLTPQITDGIFRLTTTTGFAGGTYILMENHTGIIAGSYRVNTAIAGYNFTFDSDFLEFRLHVTDALGDVLKWSGANANWDTSALNWNNGSVAYNNINKDFVEFDDTGTTTNINLAAGPFTPGNVVFSNNTKTYQLNGGNISGTTGLTAQGTGTVILNNDNSYTGITQINPGGVLQFGVGGATGSLPSAATISNEGTLIFNRSSAQTLNGLMYGPGRLVKQGSGTLTLAGENAFTGGITVNGGTVQLGGTSSYPIYGNFTADGSGATLLYNGPAQVTETLNIFNGGLANITNSTLNANTVNISGGTLAITGTAVGVTANVMNLLSGTVSITSTR